MSTDTDRRGQATPAAVFLSYARDDEASVLPLERALQERGIRVLRDKPSLPLGAGNIAGLTALIDSESDAVIFYVTPAMLESDFIWRYEVPAALRRQRRDEHFAVVPVLDGPTYRDLAIASSDRGTLSLADFNAETIGVLGARDADVTRIARRTLRSTLAARLARQEDRTENIGICLRTFPFTPPASRLHLDLDWTAAFDSDLASPQLCAADLLPALADVAGVLAGLGRGREVEAWVKARIPAAVALGHAFPRKGAVRLRPVAEGVAWSETATPSAVPPMAVTRTTLGSEPVAMVELAVSRDVTPATSRWRQARGLLPRWRIRYAPPDGPSREAIRDPGHAQAWAWQVGDELRRLWDADSIEDIHLFLAAPAEFAVLVGQQLRDRHTVHVYFGDNEAGYRLAYTLNEAA